MEGDFHRGLATSAYFRRAPLKGRVPASSSLGARPCFAPALVLMVGVPVALAYPAARYRP